MRHCVNYSDFVTDQFSSEFSDEKEMEKTKIKEKNQQKWVSQKKKVNNILAGIDCGSMLPRFRENFNHRRRLVGDERQTVNNHHVWHWWNQHRLRIFLKQANIFLVGSFTVFQLRSVWRKCIVLLVPGDIARALNFQVPPFFVSVELDSVLGWVKNILIESMTATEP